MKISELSYCPKLETEQQQNKPTKKRKIMKLRVKIDEPENKEKIKRSQK